MGLAPKERRRRDTDDLFPDLGPREEVRLQLNRREAVAFRNVVAAACSAQSVGQRDDGGRKQKPGPGDEFGSDIDMPNDSVAFSLVEDDPVQSRREGTKEVIDLIDVHPPSLVHESERRP